MQKTIIGAMLLASISVPGVEAQAKDNSEITVAVAMKTQVQRRWAFDARAMEEEAERLGIKLLFQWANDNPTTQASQVENLLSQQPDALIIVPVDSKTSGRLVRMAKEQNVPVVAYDNAVASEKVDFYVQRDNELVGKLQADAALRMAPDGTFALVKGDPSMATAQDIGKSYQKLLVENKNVKIVFDQYINGWNPKTALDNAENILSAQNDDVQGFVTSNDGMAAGVAQAIKGRNLEGKVFLSGLDVDPANFRLIYEGVQTMSVWTDIQEEASVAVQAAVELAKGNPLSLKTQMMDFGAGEIPTFLVNVVEVNQGNLCEFMNEIAPNGWIDPAEVFADSKNPCE
ncbi:MAG: substrate-binding domain-containing protein [Hoeflea sp.]|uniref:sugar ABC transporter substrate-binding protein n=1 Tax=Hoeflea sp. TaxID=1940281 RepID=UPI003298E158